MKKRVIQPLLKKSRAENVVLIEIMYIFSEKRKFFNDKVM